MNTSSALRADLRERIPAVVQRQPAKVIALRTDATPRAVENWRSGDHLPSVPAFLMLAKADPELRAWVLNVLDYEDDPERALAVLANHMARKA